jgi:protein O-GlcNAc transferase
MPETGDDQSRVEKPTEAALQARFDQAMVLYRQGNLADAERCYGEVLQQQPDHFSALHLLGVIACQTRRTERGVELIKRAIGLNPKVAAAHNNLGNALIALKRPEEALASYDKAITLKPDFAEAYNNRGNALMDLKRHEEAIASCDSAIALNPDYANAYNNRGNAFTALKRPVEALASYDKTIALKPDIAEAHNSRGDALIALKRPGEALASYDKAIALKPDYAEAYNNRGNALKGLKRHEEALASYDIAIALKPDIEFLYGNLIFMKMTVCDWSNLETQIGQLVHKIDHAEKVSHPFTLFAASNSPKLQRKAAEIYALAIYPFKSVLPKIAKRQRRNKIRIGYFSSDFRNHAGAYSMVEMFERHDHSKFEIIGFSFSPKSAYELKSRLEPAFDKIIDVNSYTDVDVAQLARNMEIDIAIDRNGFANHCRPNIFAARAAPLQVSYRGFPATMGVDYIDYLIADPIVVPADHRENYIEKIAYLPNSCQVYDTKRFIPDDIIFREQVGLPRDGFVFCSFNNNYKITPEVFDCWMRLLKQVDGSVLWLLEDNTMATSNLRKEAEIRGVNSERLIFAKRVPPLDHLARHRFADLFLDTLPCNAHTTASDALWAGLPVLTRIGETFTGRVAASLLNAIGLTELITSTPQAYEALAIELATNPEKLANLKRKLATNRLTTSLFDIQMYTRHIEAAYTMMYERYQADLQPDYIYVPQQIC